MSCEYERLYHTIKSCEFHVSQQREIVKSLEKELEALNVQIRGPVHTTLLHSGPIINTSRKSSSISAEIKRIEERLLKNADKLVKEIYISIV